MTTLLEKLRAATGGDREIDARIHAFVNSWHLNENALTTRIAMLGDDIPHYTADLSAAVALVEANGFTWAMDASAPECGCDADLFPKTKSEKQFRGTAPTPAAARLNMEKESRMKDEEIVDDGNDLRLYSEQFKAGTRVIVKCDSAAGTDREFEGRRGITLDACNASALVEFDAPPRHWSNPYWITAHNLRELRPPAQARSEAADNRKAPRPTTAARQVR